MAVTRETLLVGGSDGRMQQAYDSLQGVQPLTQEIHRMLQVTGVLLRAAGCSKPTLRNPKLDQIAGKVETVQRRQQTIRVASRSRTYKLRKQLVKGMSSLTVAPAKLSFVSKHFEGKKGATEDKLPMLVASVCGQTSHYLWCCCKTHQAGRIKGSAKSRARSRNTSKALPFGSTTAKSDDLCIDSPSADVARKGHSIVRQGSAAPADVAGDDVPLHKDFPDCNTRADKDTGEVAVASDPISDTFSQAYVWGS